MKPLFNHTMEWFAEWFNTPFYHILYKSRNDKEAQLLIDNIEKLLNFDTETHKILDLACGKGRHSIYLNSKGYDVVGVDLSENNIKIANQSANEKLHFFVHDMREVFRENTFDFVLNLFTSFGYFEDEADNLKSIQSISENLKKGGRLVLDYMNSNKAIKHLSMHYEKEVEGIHFVINKTIENRFILKNIDFDFEGKHYHFQERVKALTFEDFEGYFEKSGLKIVDCFGNYQFENFDSENSDRMIFVAEKI